MAMEVLTQTLFLLFFGGGEDTSKSTHTENMTPSTGTEKWQEQNKRADKKIKKTTIRKQAN